MGEYLQVDLGRVKIVSKVKTQGRYNADMWTKAFKLRYSSDSKRWIYYSKVSTTTAEAVVIVIIQMER